MTPNDAILSVRDLRIEIEGSGVDIDDQVDLVILRGEVLGLVGESASGKTTVATALLGYERRGAKIASGSVNVGGYSVLSLSPKDCQKIRGGVISYVPQDPSMSLNPALRIGKQLIEILEWHSYGNSGSERRQRVSQMMSEVLLPADESFLRRYPHQLSGGQQQRVAVAMAFACRPAVIVLDEPTTGLDVTTQAHVLSTVKSLAGSYGVSVLYVTHDLAVVANLADRIAVMYAGRLVEIGGTRELFRHASHPYTRMLIRAVPDLSGKYRIQGIAGRAPLPGRRPRGCFFAPRCPSASPQCEQAFPPYEEAGEQHQVRCWHWREVGAKPVPFDLLVRKTTGRLDDLNQSPVMTVHQLKAYYESEEILHGVNATIWTHRCLALVGESGSGKTTMARCIAGIHAGRYMGEIRLGNTLLAQEARKRSKMECKSIQYVFQSPYASLNPRWSISQILRLPLKRFYNLSRREMHDRMVAALEMVSLDGGLLSRYPDQLSGGERQRVAIARALEVEPSVIICDEITSSLDVSVQATIVDLLNELLAETNVAMLFVTHHLPLVRHLAQDVIVMNEGEIVEFGEVDEVLAAPQADYTRRLLSDTPDVERVMR